MKNKTEKELADIATYSLCDDEANEAMELLRNKFDKTYHWSDELDGLAVSLSQLRKVVGDGYKF